METIENELLEVIDINTIANLEQGTKAAKLCAIVARDYAAKFGEWCVKTSNGAENGQFLFREKDFSPPSIKTAKEMLQKFDESQQSAKNSK